MGGEGQKGGVGKHTVVLPKTFLINREKCHMFEYRRKKF